MRMLSNAQRVDIELSPFKHGQDKAMIIDRQFDPAIWKRIATPTGVSYVRHRPKRPKDMQANKLYAAENTVFDKTKAMEFREVCKFTANLINFAFVQRRYGAELNRAPVHVTEKTRGHYARGGATGIFLPPWAWNKGIICHELAHVIVQRRHGGTVAAHGWEFAAIYLDLVQAALGPERRLRLEAAFKAGKVRFRAPRVSNLTMEQRAEIAARLKAARP